jgi:hypothetical protein
MLVDLCRDFTCPHCGALYKLVRVPKFESNRLDYDLLSRFHDQRFSGRADRGHLMGPRTLFRRA